MDTISRQREATLEFMRRCSAAPSSAAIAELLFAEMARCGIAYVACASHVDPLNPPQGAVAMVNYPWPWLSHFSQSNYAKRDPIFFAAHNSLRPFPWNEYLRRQKLAADQKRILNEARECGIVDGVTIPIHSPGALPASCSLIPGPDGFEPLIMPDLQFMAMHAHEEARLRSGGKVREPVTLTKRQWECLVLCAGGKSDADIGSILNISPRTVHHTVDNARKRYGVASRVQAVMFAYIDGSISRDDILR